MSVLTGSKSVWVSNATELTAALSAAQAGSTIYLNPGDYGDLSISKMNFAGAVTIKSADAANPAVFDTLKLSYSSNITFSDVIVHLEPTTETTIHTEAVRVVNSSGIRIENSEISGGKAISGVTMDTLAGGLDSSGNVIGLPTGRGINIYQSDNVVLDNNDISSFYRGIVMTSVQNVKITNNEIHDLRISPIAGGDVSHVEVSGNHAYNFTPWQFGGSGDHGDFVHFWTVPTRQTGASTDIKVTGNFFDQGSGQAILGIYLDDNRNGLGFTNAVIEQNVIYNGNGQGIRLEYVRDSLISHNSLIQATGAANDAPGVVLRAGSTRLTISDNIFAGISKSADIGLVTEANNLILQRHDKTAADYYGNYFINALTQNPELSDLQALPGGQIERLNVGAYATRYDSTPDALTAVGTGKVDTADHNLYHFDASLSASPAGLLTAAQANYVWDFGDGTKATGIKVSHRYDTPGDYDVKLTVVQTNGATDTAHTQANVFDPLLLNINFDGGDLSDKSSYDSTVKYPDLGTTVLSSSTGGAYKLAVDNDFKVIGTTARQIFNLEDFSFNFSLKRDSALDGTGDLFRIQSSWKVSLLKSGELNFAITNDAGQNFSITTKGARITDTNWHNVSLVLNGDADTATFFVDGNKVGSGTVTGSTQNYENWGLQAGNPWGDNFHGLLDNISLSADPFSDAAVKELHQGNFAALSTVVADTPPAVVTAPSEPVVTEPVATSTSTSTSTSTPTSTSTQSSTAPTSDWTYLYARYAQIFSQQEIKTSVADSRVAIADPAPSAAFKAVNTAAFAASSPALADFSSLHGADQAYVHPLAGINLF